MNDQNNLIIEECKSDKDWNDFVLKSENLKFYSLSEIVKLEKNSKRFFVLKKKEKLASFNLNIEKDKVLHPIYSIYTPINYKKLVNTKKSSHYSFYFDINEKICNFLVQNYNSINITFDHLTSDIRAFSWYGFPDYKNKFLLDLRYTYVSNIEKINFVNFQHKEIFLNSSETNRREIRNSLKKNYYFEESFSKKLFIELKKKSYELHGKQIDIAFYEKILTALEQLYEKKLVKMFIGYHKEIPFSMTVFSTIGNKAIFLHSGRNHEGDNKNLFGIYQIFNSIIKLSNSGISTLDFEGINSPRNSFSKLKFGGRIFPYYNLNLNV